MNFVAATQMPRGLEAVFDLSFAEYVGSTQTVNPLSPYFLVYIHDLITWLVIK